MVSLWGFGLEGTERQAVSSAPRLAVRNIRVDDKTTFSLRVSWQPPHTSSLQHYRLSYSSAGGPEETVSGPGERSGTTQSSC